MYTVLSQGVRSFLWTHPEIIPVGQFFRRWIKSINQSIKSDNNSPQRWWKHFVVGPFGCLIDDKLTLTWLVSWIRTAGSVFTGAGLKSLNIAGQYSTERANVEEAIVIWCILHVSPIVMGSGLRKKMCTVVWIFHNWDYAQTYLKTNNKNYQAETIFCYNSQSREGAFFVSAKC